MPLGMELGLGPRDFVLDGDPAPLPKKGNPIFGPFLLWLNGWIHQDATWYIEVGLSQGDFGLDGDPAVPS